MRIVPIPLNDLVEGISVDGITTWQITGSEPRFLLKASPGALRRGLYRLDFDLPSGWSTLVLPKLRVDFGNGFDRSDPIPLRFSGEAPDAQAYVWLDRKAVALRFDPGATLTSLSLGSISLHRCSLTAWRARRILHLIRTRIRSRAALGRASRVLVRTFWAGGFDGVRSRLRLLQGSAIAADYPAWTALFDTLTTSQLAEMAADVEGFEHKPLISVLMPTYNTPLALLEEAIESVRAQVYPHWELCIADDASTDRQVRTMLSAFAEKDARIKVIFRPKNGHISHASNSALELVTGEWVAMLDHDDLLRPHALYHVAREINRHPATQMIYSDEDKLAADGTRYDAFFKSDFSWEAFRSINYLNHLSVHRTQNIRAVGGWRAGFEGSQDYDLNLRVLERLDTALIRHIPKILYHWRAVAGSTAAASSEKSYAYRAGTRALQEHIARGGYAAEVEESDGRPYYRLRFRTPQPPPLVTLIIPTRDHVALLKGCIESIVEKTAYGPYEILIVDNGSTDPKTLAYLDHVAKRANIRVLRYSHPFNYSAINNFAVEHANGTLIGLVNNDIEVISEDWLGEMVSWASQPEIGCVGAKLYYGSDLVQHAGVIVGLGGVAGHSHKYAERAAEGYFFRLRYVQNLSAVTAACLVVRKSVFLEVGGLNAQDLEVAFNDVDFCLKVREAGYRNVWTPHAELYHLESISRGAEDDPAKIARFAREVAYMKRTWGEKLSTDPFYSPNLTLDHEDFSLAFPPRDTNGP